MRLECDGVQLRFQSRSILNGVYLHMEKGSVIALFGRNGAGKSCLMKIIFGLITPQECSVRVDGRYLHQRVRHHSVSYLPQGELVPGHLRVGRALSLFGAAESELISLTPTAKSMINYSFGQLASGERRLIEAFLVLNSHQPFSLLDEPFTGLAPIQIERLSEYIGEVSKRKAILISDHLHHRVVPLMNRGYMLSDGYSFQIENEEDLVRRGYLHERSI